MTKIMEKLANDGCGTYTPWSNNCEHVATYVRYGVHDSKQVRKKCSTYFSVPEPTGKKVLRRAAPLKRLLALA
ncbi:hypothetical protein SKAU_G00075470 [Synaphobranchus kaupii]|uniref:LRAT domain-containing protein n=1 Tax=Synaphobranchus kaupii TaxID=118154 RepID=A0A9Q1JC56_SYNKA|nr:hypothetical protein SKAU_G00075470 [Synaphobranchus kaupii]